MSRQGAAQPDATARRRGARRRARTRQLILEAAESVFRRDGFERARIESIAEEADVSVGSIYVHFAGKHALYLAVVERALELFEKYLALAEDPDLTPLQRVLAGGEAYLRFHLEHPGAFQLLAVGVAGGTPDGAASAAERRIRDRVGALLDRFAALIEDAVKAGEAKPVDAPLLTRYLWGAWNGVIGLRLQPVGLRLSDAEITQTLELGRWLLREGLADASLRDADGEVGDRVELPRLR